MHRDERVTDEMVDAAQAALSNVRYGLTDTEMRAALRAALEVEQLVSAKPDYWTSHNNYENMLGKGVTDEKDGVVWDFATQEWVNADVPLYATPPSTRIADRAEQAGSAITTNGTGGCDE